MGDRVRNPPCRDEQRWHARGQAMSVCFQLMQLRSGLFFHEGSHGRGLFQPLGQRFDNGA